MEHKKLVSRQSGPDGWFIRCSCGRKWTGWRWLIEEMFYGHLPELEPPVITMKPEDYD